MTLTVLSQPMVDVLVSCDKPFLQRLNFPPGSYGMLNDEECCALLRACHQLKTPRRLMSGGSGANSVACAKLLGVKAAYMGLAGEDEFGRLFHEDLIKLGVQVPNPLQANAPTATCISLVTQDAERTMRTHLGVALNFGPQHIDMSVIEQSSFVMVEGYYLAGSENTRHALYHALDRALGSGVQTVFSVAADFVVRQYRQEILNKTLTRVDLLVANANEAKLLADTDDVSRAFEFLCTRTRSCIVTNGKDGALISYKGNRFHAPAFTDGIIAVDTTGAGDAYLGAFLAGLLHGLTPQRAAKGASRISAAVVAQHGARLPESAVELWRQSVYG